MERRSEGRRILALPNNPAALVQRCINITVMVCCTDAPSGRMKHWLFCTNFGCNRDCGEA
nr:MAG TPA: hypothetical protein [Bacteriophage sp.]